MQLYLLYVHTDSEIHGRCGNEHLLYLVGRELNYRSWNDFMSRNEIGLFGPFCLRSACAGMRRSLVRGVCLDGALKPPRMSASSEDDSYDCIICMVWVFACVNVCRNTDTDLQAGTAIPERSFTNPFLQVSIVIKP
jgi:hypothetical protein